MIKSKFKLVLLVCILSIMTLYGLNVKAENHYKVFMPLVITPSLTDIHCEDPIGPGNGDWPVCPRIMFFIRSGVAHLGPNIHNWSEYRLIRIDPSHGDIWSQDMSENPLYNPDTWELVAKLKPIQQTYDLSCKDGYYIVLGELDLPDPRGVIPNFQFCLAQ